MDNQLDRDLNENAGNKVPEDGSFSSGKLTFSMENTFGMTLDPFSEDSPYKNAGGQGSLSKDSPYKSTGGQGSLSEDSPYKNAGGQGSLSEGRGSAGGHTEPGKTGSAGGYTEPGKTGSAGGYAGPGSTGSNGDSGGKKNGKAIIALAGIFVAGILAFLLLSNVISGPAQKKYEPTSSNSSAMGEDAAGEEAGADEASENDEGTQAGTADEQSDTENKQAAEDAEAADNEVEKEESEEVNKEESGEENKEESGEENEEETEKETEKETEEETEEGTEETEEGTAEDKEQLAFKERFERASKYGMNDPLTEDDFVLYDTDDEDYSDLSGKTLFISYEENNSTVTPRGVRRGTTEEEAITLYGEPHAQGSISRECKFYYILHDFEGEYDEDLKEYADENLGRDYFEYYWNNHTLAFGFDENGEVEVIAVDHNSRLFW